jgi:hypothetical protein
MKKLETSPAKEKIKRLILELTAKEKSANMEKLQFMQQQTRLKPKSTKQLMDLENKCKILFPKPDKPTQVASKEYVFSQKALWYWEIMALSIATTVSVFTIPVTSYPIAYLRNFLGIIFVLFLPGYAFIKALLPQKVPVKTINEDLDKIERIALNIGMSLALVPLVGIVLYYSPLGLRLTPIMLGLLAFTIICATAALLREHQAFRKPLYSQKV